MTMCSSPALLAHCDSAVAGVRKKCSKPLIEKRRRERINRCLSELQALLAADGATAAAAASAAAAATAAGGDDAKPSSQHQQQSTARGKLEKADILEMTVKHVRLLRRLALTGCREKLKLEDGGYQPAQLPLPQQQQQQQQQQQHNQQLAQVALGDRVSPSSDRSFERSGLRGGGVGVDSGRRSLAAPAAATADVPPPPAYLVLDNCGGAYVATAPLRGGCGGDSVRLPSLAAWAAAATGGCWRSTAAAAAQPAAQLVATDAAAAAAAAACRELMHHNGRAESCGGDGGLEAWRFWVAEAAAAHRQQQQQASGGGGSQCYEAQASTGDLWRPW